MFAIDRIIEKQLHEEEPPVLVSLALADAASYGSAWREATWRRSTSRISLPWNPR